MSQKNRKKKTKMSKKRMSQKIQPKFKNMRLDLSNLHQNSKSDSAVEPDILLIPVKLTGAGSGSDTH